MMGGLNTQAHWDCIVVPAVKDFIEAEDRLANASDPDEVWRETYRALRFGMSASFFLYHFAELVLDRGDYKPQPIGRERMKDAMYREIGSLGRNADGEPRGDDHKILGEVVDAVKHCKLTSDNIIHVDRDGLVISISDGIPFADPQEAGNGSPQIVVRLVGSSKGRSLRAIHLNVMRGWKALLNDLNAEFI